MSVQKYAERQRYHANERPRKPPSEGRAKHACPRPDRCDHCEMTIGTHAPVWYDRMRPLLVEHTNALGETSVGGEDRRVLHALLPASASRAVRDAAGTYAISVRLPCFCPLQYERRTRRSIRTSNCAACAGNRYDWVIAWSVGQRQNKTKNRAGMPPAHRNASSSDCRKATPELKTAPNLFRRRFFLY